MAKVTGIGGVFIKARRDAKALAAWYETHLGVVLNEWGGAELKWPDDPSADGGLTVWCTSAPDSDWFAPSDAGFMINYRVDDLRALIKDLTARGVNVVKGPEAHENGLFAWIMDPDGNKLELWEAMPWDEQNKSLPV